MRVYSKSISPNAREGYYIVIHFSADGSACFFTIGCGSTIWRNGDLSPISDEELAARTSWGRSVVVQRWGKLDPFSDQIALGAKANLPRTFEKATVLAKRISVQELQSIDLDKILFDAAERLNEIYLAQMDRRDISSGEILTEEISLISQPLKRRGVRQGYGLSSKERKAVELRAMALAINYLEQLGYECRDTSDVESFDILASKGSEAIKVEVKGTTSDFAESVLMTRREVDLHRSEKGNTSLIIVSKIRLKRENDDPIATEGVVDAQMNWDIDQWTAEPIAFQVSRRTQ